MLCSAFFYFQLNVLPCVFQLVLLVLVWMCSKFKYQSMSSSCMLSWTTKFSDASVPKASSGTKPVLCNSPI